MSTLVISDLSFLEELDNQESKVAGAASAGADRDDAVAAGGSTTKGNLRARADGYFVDYHLGYTSPPFAAVEVYGR